MHAVLLTLMALGADASSAGAQHELGAVHSECGCADECDGSCGGGRRDTHRGGWFGHMPQTCYMPRYGCYPGNSRHTHRYPAFHGTYYRNPYNYRNLFDYPWHAQLHEPTSHFSYNVVEEESVFDGALPPLPPTSTGLYRGASASEQRATSNESTRGKSVTRTISAQKSTSIGRASQR